MAHTYRDDFPLLNSLDIAHLDNAATAQRPQCVLDAVTEFYKSKNANPLRGLYPLSVSATESYESARDTVRDFLNAKSSSEIIFTRNTTEGLNLVAYSYGLSNVKAGDEVLVSIMEHHSNLLPWQMVCRWTGAALKFMECEPDGTLDLNKVASLITPKTKIVACTHVSNVLGRVNPIREIAELAHRVGAVMVVDAAQSTPHIPVDVQALGADFLSFSGHKVYGPMGIGVLYGREELLDAMPPFLPGSPDMVYPKAGQPYEPEPESGAAAFAPDKGGGEQPSPRLQNPPGFRQSFFRVRHNMEGVGDHDRIKALRPVGQLGGVLDGEMEPRRINLLFGLTDHFR